MAVFCQGIGCLGDDRYFRVPGLDDPHGLVTIHDRHVQVHKHKVDILMKTAASLDVILVLMEKHALIGTPDERGFINMSGNLGMERQRSEEALVGTIAAMLCQGFSREGAVRQGVFIYGLAEDLVVQKKGESGVMAEEIVDHLPLAIKICRDGLSKALADRAAA